MDRKRIPKYEIKSGQLPIQEKSTAAGPGQEAGAELLASIQEVLNDARILREIYISSRRSVTYTRCCALHDLVAELHTRAAANDWAEALVVWQKLPTSSLRRLLCRIPKKQFNETRVVSLSNAWLEIGRRIAQLKQ